MANDVHNDVIGFIAFQPDMLCTTAPDEHTNFGSPRSWTRVSQMMAVGGTDQDALASLVGPGPAAQFRAYQDEVKSLPNLHDERATYTENPSRITVSYALALSLSTLIIKGDTRLPSACRVMTKSIAPEIGCLFFVRCMQHSEELSKKVLACPDALSWARKNHNLISKYGRNLTQ